MTAVSEPFSAAPQAPEQAIEGKSPRQLFWERFRKDKAAIGGLITVLDPDPARDLRAAHRKASRRARPERALPDGDARRLRPAQGAERGLLVRRRPIGAGRVRPRALRRAYVPARRDRRHRSRRRDRSHPRADLRLLQRVHGHGHRAQHRHHPRAAAAPVRNRDRGGLRQDEGGVLQRPDPAGLEPGHLHHRPLQLALHRAHRSWQRALDTREGVRRGGPIARRRATSGSCSARCCRT